MDKQNKILSNDEFKSLIIEWQEKNSRAAFEFEVIEDELKCDADMDFLNYYESVSDGDVSDSMNNFIKKILEDLEKNE